MSAFHDTHVEGVMVVVFFVTCDAGAPMPNHAPNRSAQMAEKDQAPRRAIKKKSQTAAGTTVKTVLRGRDRRRIEDQAAWLKGRGTFPPSYNMCTKMRFSALSTQQVFVRCCHNSHTHDALLLAACSLPLAVGACCLLLLFAAAWCCPRHMRLSASLCLSRLSPL